MEVLSGNRECVPNSIYVLYTCTYEALKEIETDFFHSFSFSLLFFNAADENEMRRARERQKRPINLPQ
jgi:hypothetical protein